MCVNMMDFGESQYNSRREILPVVGLPTILASPALMALVSSTAFQVT